MQFLFCNSVKMCNFDEFLWANGVGDKFLGHPLPQ